MTQQILGVSFYIGIAGALAFICIVVLGFMLHAGTRIRKEPLPLLFFAIIIAIMAAPVAMGRSIIEGLAMSEASADEVSSSFWLNRIITLGILALCAERILRFIIRREWTSVHSWSLFWLFVVFGLSNQILNGIFGSHPSFDHKYLYPFVIYFCVFLVAQSQPERCLRIARAALLFFFICSAVAAVVIPSVVVQTGYAGGLPGISFRYYGLVTHANAMGPLALVFMICLWRFPFHSRWINRASWFLVTISLILTQSKTTIIAAIVIGLFLVIYRYRNRLMQRYAGGRSGMFIGTIAFLCFSFSIAILAAWFGSDTFERIIHRTRSGQWGKTYIIHGAYDHLGACMARVFSQPAIRLRAFHMESCLPIKHRPRGCGHSSQSAPAFLKQRRYCRCSRLDLLWSSTNHLCLSCRPAF